MYKIFGAKSPNSSDKGSSLLAEKTKYTFTREEVSEIYKQAHLDFTEESGTKSNDGTANYILTGKQINDLLARASATKQGDAKELDVEKPMITDHATDVPTASSTEVLTPKNTRQTLLDKFVVKDADDTSWQVAGRGKKRKVVISPINAPESSAHRISPVAISNRFGKLGNGTEEDKVPNVNDNVSNTQPSSKKTRPPPIFIHNVALILGL